MTCEFRMSGKAVRLALGLAGTFGLPGAAIVLMGMYVVFMPTPHNARDIDPTIVWIGAAMMLTIGTLMIFAASLAVILTRSRLVVGSTGIEYRRWPLPTTFCQWPEVERISSGNIRGIAYTSLLYKPIGSTPGARVGAVRAMPLSDFDGWPSGDLAIQIRRYLPELFESPEGELS